MFQRSDMILSGNTAYGEKRAGRFVAIIALLSASGAAWAQAGPGISRLAADGSGTAIQDYSIDTMKVRASQYLSEAGSTVGYSWVDGPQYAIETPKLTEVLHAMQGEVTYVDHHGGLHTVRPGDVMLISPDVAYTARDGKNYSHLYISFPRKPSPGEISPQIQTLRPADLKPNEITQGPRGDEHVYLTGENGIRVTAWLPAPSGSVSKAKHNEYIAVTAGHGQIVSGTETTSFKAGDTLLVRKGTSFSWSGTDIQTICVTF